MSDVEKYGLFAVVFVGGLLLVVAFKGGLGDEAPVAAAGPAPIVLEEPIALGAAPGQVSSNALPSSLRVKELMPGQSFRFDEQPVPYPGPRSSSSPESGLKAVTPVSTGAQPASGLPATHTVAEGDNLSRIAKRYLGSEVKWTVLADLNPGVDPHNLKIGQVLRISGSAPGAAAPAGPAPVAGVPSAVKPGAEAKATPKGDAVGGRTHVVKSGDTLGGIARKYLGSVTPADDIYRANKDRLADPDHLSVGQVLRIP